MKLLRLLLFAILFVNNAFAEKAVPAKIKSFSDKQFVSYSLFIPSVAEIPEIKTEVTDYTLFDVDQNQIKSIIKTNPDFIRLIVGNTKLVLYRVSVTAPGFTIETSENQSILGLPMVHYRGIIENDYNSLASISVSENEVCGFYSNSKSNFVVGKLKKSSQHIVYDDKSLVKPFDFRCQEVPTTTKYPASNLTTASTKCLNIYYEIDNDLYIDFNSNLNDLTTFVQGAFAQVATLYANDSMNVALSQIYVWTTADPYIGPGLYDYLTQFTSYRPTFNGDLSHLLGRNGGGGIAYRGVLCNTAGIRAAYSMVGTIYYAIPTYSWTVEVLSHEMGHNVASPHTHACYWNGNNTAIDGCGPTAGYTEGSCPTAPLPTNGGTVMSYCHLVRGVGINFSNGFGPQPAALMQSAIAFAGCLTSGCDTTTPPPPPPPPPPGGCTTAPATPGPITGPTNVCKYAQNLQYSIQPVLTATSYTWTVPGGCTFVINGTTYPGPTLTGNVTTIGVNFGNKKGNISVKAVNSCGISRARNLAIKIVCREGLFATNNDVVLYPNPASTFLSLNFTADKTDDYVINVFDNVGKLILQQSKTYNEGFISEMIDISALNNGSYILQISNVDGLYNKRFTILK